MQKSKYKFRWLHLMFLNDGLFALGLLLTPLLQAFGLKYRMWVVSALFIMFAVMIISAVGYLVNKVGKKNPVSGLILLILTVILLIFGFFFLRLTAAFMIEPQHVVVRNGKKMVAQVGGFLDVHVDYYEYKNIFVSGNEVLIRENYGSGAYDPFVTNPRPAPESTQYY